VDSRLIKVNKLDIQTIQKLGLQWFANGDNAQYLIGSFVKLTSVELDDFKHNAEDLYKLGLKAAKHVIDHRLWKEMHIPTNCIDLIQHSFKHELDNHVISRMDFTGGMDRVPMKFLEFNADTCTLIPETVHIQAAHFQQEKKNLYDKPYTYLYEDLVVRFRYILNKYPDREKSLLITTMGYKEDWLNTEVIGKAAAEAGFTNVQSMLLEKVTFSPDEGIFIELNNDEFMKFEFVFKLVPWEFIAYEEPDLLDILKEVILNDLAIIINPIWTMLLQSKGIGIVMKDLDPYNPLLLKTLRKPEFTEPYFGKPIFGRIGENIKLFTSASEVIYETEGDHGDYPLIYQEAAKLNMDIEGHRYQPSMFWTGSPSAFCLRRQDDPVIDDDTEFVPHTVF
jgi:glutathionylspermidine synthase